LKWKPTVGKTKGCRRLCIVPPPVDPSSQADVAW